MALLRDYSHDIFVSYGRIDNIPERRGRRGWVDIFVDHLSIRLLKRFGETVDIWRDIELDRSQLFERAITDALKGSAIMISLISNRYMKSKYCQQEIESFKVIASSDKHGFTINDHVRIFPVFLCNLPLDEWPDACKGTLAFKFHDASGSEYGEPLNPDSEAFQIKMRQLVDELHSLLATLKKSETIENAEERLVAEDSSRITVFVASTADDMANDRRRLIRVLNDDDVNIISKIPPPYEYENHRYDALGAIKKSDLSLHLLGTYSGRAFDDDCPENTYPMEQLQIGLKHSKSQFILMPDHLNIADIEDESYAAFLKELLVLPRERKMLEIVQASRQQMVNEVLDKISKLREEKEALPVSRQTVAFVDLHVNDMINASDLLGYLARNRISPVTIPSADIDPAFSIELFEDYIKKARIFIVVFGVVARNWVEHRLNEAVKLIVANRLPTRVGVYVAPPHKSPDQVQFARGLFKVMNNMERFDPSTVESLLQDVLC